MGNVVSPKIREYVEGEILPRYDELRGHTGEHIAQVISRSLEFAKQAPVNPAAGTTHTATTVRAIISASPANIATRVKPMP